MQPKVSIITVNYNDGKGLRATAESIINQTRFDALEWIVIDGGSTDDSVAVIKEYADKIAYWISEPDSGIYNAMNKGVAQARGEYFLFRNAGDLMYDDKVIENFINHPAYGHYDHCAGHAVMTISGKWWKTVPPWEEISLYSFFVRSWFHPVTFTRSSRFKHTQYDESLKIAADTKFFIQDLIHNNASYTPLNFHVCVFDYGGVSSQNQQISDQEHHQVIREMVPHRILIDYYHLIRDDNKKRRLLTDFIIHRTWECTVLSFMAYIINFPRYIFSRAKRLYDKLTH